MSHPTRVRGLKPRYLNTKECGLLVAPHTGAWIETIVVTVYINQNVAPHTGAWIETHQLPKGMHFYDVAPHTGAWIETAMAH